MHMVKYLRTTIYFIVSAADYEVSTQLTKFFYTYARKKNVTPKKPLEAEAMGLEVMEEPLLFLMDEFAHAPSRLQLEIADATSCADLVPRHQPSA